MSFTLRIGPGPDEEVWYRYSDPISFNEWDPTGPTLERLRVLRHTEHGVWLDRGYGRGRFAYKGARASFAYPTVEEAANSYLERKKKAVKYAYQNLAKQEAMLKFAEALPTKEPVTV